MTPQKPPDANTAVLSAFPAKSRAMLQLIEKNRATEVGQILTDFAASALHPDFVCNLGAFTGLPTEVKTAALEFLSQAFSPGFTLDEAGAMFAWLTPHIEGSAGPSNTERN